MRERKLNILHITPARARDSRANARTLAHAYRAANGIVSRVICAIVPPSITSNRRGGSSRFVLSGFTSISGFRDATTEVHPSRARETTDFPRSCVPSEKRLTGKTNK